MGPRRDLPPITVRLAIFLLTLVCVRTSLAQDAAAQRRPYPHRATWCDFITRLGVDLVSDGVPAPAGYEVPAGEMRSGRVMPFNVAALTDSPGFFVDVSHEVRHTSFRIRPPRDGPDVGGRLSHTSYSSPLYYFYTRRDTAEDRVAFLDVIYHCRAPNKNYERRLMVTLRGTLRDEAPPQEPASPAPLPTSPIRAASSSAPQLFRRPGQQPITDIAVKVEAVQVELLQDETSTFAITVTNHGPNVAAPIVYVPWQSSLVGVSDEVSQGVAWWGHRSEIGEFRPGDLASGASATVTYSGRAPLIGTFKASARLSNTIIDSNAKNNESEATITVSRPPRPDLTAQWLSAELSRTDTLRRFQVGGVLRVSNDGDAPSGPTRLVLFISRDDLAGPEDQFAGFADVPALAAGASVDLTLQRRLRSQPHLLRSRVLAVVDSSNTEREIDETNNNASFPLQD